MKCRFVGFLYTNARELAKWLKVVYVYEDINGPIIQVTSPATLD
jgi:hypothetical protein